MAANDHFITDAAYRTNVETAFKQKINLVGKQFYDQKMLKQQKVGCVVGLQLGRVEVGLARELREQRLKVGLLREGFGHRPILPSAPQRPLPRQL